MITMTEFCFEHIINKTSTANTSMIPGLARSVCLCLLHHRHRRRRRASTPLNGSLGDWRRAAWRMMGSCRMMDAASEERGGHL